MRNSARVMQRVLPLRHVNRLLNTVLCFAWSRDIFNLATMDCNRVNVHVREGKLIGIVEKSVYGHNYISFLGIPYAKPPIGELRFKDPVPPEPWSGGRDASKYGNICVQMNFLTNEIIGDEDCLYLNVYTTNIIPKKKYPVMVWIHGGGFSSGSGDKSYYGPDYIIQKDVVLVTLNYRLGVFGFLNLYDKVATGNQGLKDIVMALQWVQKNISNFGGDPENVTIFGQSSGGGIVNFLAISPVAEGLFHKAISQSGVATNPCIFTKRELALSKNAGFRLTEKLGKVTTDAKVAYEFLKGIDAKKLRLVEQKALLTKLEKQQYFLPFTPSMDYESSKPFFPKDIKTLIRHGVKVPFLLGCTNCEGLYYVASIHYTKRENLKEIDSDFRKAIYPTVLSELPHIPITLEELRFLYFGNKAVSEETLMNYIHFFEDTYFYRSFTEAVDIQTKCGHSATYMYKLSYDNKSSIVKKSRGITLPGATHTEDLFYLFYPHIKKSFLPPELDSEEYKVISRLVQMWTDFAKTGNPTPVITDLIPIKWMPLKCGNICDYLNIDTELQMKTFRKGEQRWDWENMKSIKNKL